VKEIDSNNTNLIETLADILVIMIDLSTDLIANYINYIDLKKRLKM